MSTHICLVPDLSESEPDMSDARRNQFGSKEDASARVCVEKKPVPSCIRIEDVDDSCCASPRRWNLVLSLWRRVRPDR